jgi:hypothetical protein
MKRVGFLAIVFLPLLVLGACSNEVPSDGEKVFELVTGSAKRNNNFVSYYGIYNQGGNPRPGEYRFFLEDQTLSTSTDLQVPPWMTVTAEYLNLLSAEGFCPATYCGQVQPQRCTLFIRVYRNGTRRVFAKTENGYTGRHVDVRCTSDPEEIQIYRSRPTNIVRLPTQMAPE